MPVPPFNVDGVIPPYVGSNGPGGIMTDMSPYYANCLEVVQALGTTQHRLMILKGWLDHRVAIRAASFVSGFQWLDGSFLEDKVPNDLDLVIFVERPAGLVDFSAFIRANMRLIDRSIAKVAFSLDLFWVDLNTHPQAIVTLSRYYFGLFSHRRGDDLWKGMLEVGLVDATEDAAIAHVVAALDPEQKAAEE